MAEEPLILLEEGFAQVQKDGIEPFLAFIEDEDQKREFFKAKEFVSLYDRIFKMCIQREPYNYSEDMYKRYTAAIRNHCKTRVYGILKEAQNSIDTVFLKQWVMRWTNQKLIVKGLSKLFMYLDRFYTENNSEDVCKLTDQGYKLYKEEIYVEFAPHARRAILNAIQKERDGEAQDRHLLQQAVQVFVDMGYNYNNMELQVYKQDLEKAILEHTSAFYQRKARTWMDQESCAQYLVQAENALNQERQRVDNYLNQSTMQRLQTAVYDEVLKVQQRELLEKETGIFFLLEANRTDDLARLYRVYQSYPEDLQPIADLVYEHIRKAGAAVVDKAQAEKMGPDTNHSLVRNLIDLHTLFAGIIRECFGNNQVFQKALKTAFEQFINVDARVSKQLAKFVNDVLKKGTTVKANEMESTLDNVVFLYGYLTEKDVFERDYQMSLANRLLLGQCESEHAEKSMIAKLKTEAGYQWTNKLEGMFKDVQLSTDLMQKFRRHYDSDKSQDFQLEVNVCTTGYWPQTKYIGGIVPQEAMDACNRFKQFYLNLHSTHKLEWRLDQGKAEVAVQFSPTVKRTLVCSTYQAMLLLAFNTGGKQILNFEQLLEMTGVPEAEIAPHLLSLAHPKVGVLSKRPNSKELEKEHQFMINGKYTSQLLKVQIPVLKQVSEAEKKVEDDAIDLQRQHQIEASIVRVMKTRKTLKHNMLVGEVITQLSARFKPNPLVIKKRIEALIELEYLKRDENDRGTYNYLA